MIRRAEEMICEIKEQMRGGRGSVEIMHIFGQNDIKGKARLCAKVTIQPGSSIGLHQHLKEEEIYYIIKGSGVVNDNGMVKEIGTGDSVLTGDGASHSIENTGDDILELIAIILFY